MVGLALARISVFKFQRQRFGSMLRMIAALPLPDGWRTRRDDESSAQKSSSGEKC